jgi:TolB-like protein/DNA-binding winged helix-turn-helix (wHTH) protein
MAMPVAQEKLQIGEWLVDPAIDTINRGSETIKLEPRMMRLLLCLAEQPGAVVSQERLLNDVWAGVVVGPASVYQSVSQLRKLLGDVGEEATYIATVPRKGYRLVAKAGLVSAIPAMTPAETPAIPVGLNATLTVTTTKRRLMKYGAIVAGLAVLVGISWAPLKDYLSAAQTPSSIAVLPFVDLTTTKNDQPFCDGLTEELSNWLAQLPILRVVSRTSAFAFRDKQLDVREIGKQLGATHILEGSVRRTGADMRVTVQLIDARDGYHIWSGSFNSPFADAVKLQEEIARSVAANLEIRMTQVTDQRFLARKSGNAQAYQLYLVARYHQQQLTRQDNDRAVELFRQSIAIDPKFALAYVRLAYAYLNQRYFNDRAVEDIGADAEPLLAIAEKLNPALPDLYAVRGALATDRLRSNDALRDLQRAVDLNPNAVEAHTELGFFYLTSARPREALQHYTTATTLDPVNFVLHAQRCMALQDLARFDEAALACERARALRPEAAWPYTVTSTLEASQGYIDEALRWNKQAMQRSSNASEPYIQRCNWLLTLGLVASAREAYEKAVSKDRGDTSGNPGLRLLGYTLAMAEGGLPALRKQIATNATGLADSSEMLLDTSYAELLAGDFVAARRQLDRALASQGFSAEALDQPWSVRTGFSYQLIAAVAELETGSTASAKRRLERLKLQTDQLINAGVERYGVYELQAQVFAYSGDAERAMRALRRAFELGWRGVWWAEHEPYLASLRTRGDYQSLIQRTKALNERTRRTLNESAPI